MSPNCLACSDPLQRKDVDECNENKEKVNLRKYVSFQIDRSWSGDIPPPPYQPPYEHTVGGAMDVVKKNIKKSHRRAHSTGAFAFERSSEPRLVRSGGVRRDWSLENLQELMEAAERKH